MGIRIPSTGGQILDGWLEFSATGTTFGDFTLTFERYGYEDAGNSITMGETAFAVVPLPAPGFLVLGGILALDAIRRSRTRDA